MAYRAQPSSNRICTAVNQNRDASTHKQRVDKIRPTVDTSSPATMALLINKSKKDQLMEERCSQIDYENRILLKKMSHIMRSNNVDNVQQLKPKSLNAESRKRELKKIMDDNQSILRRIQTRRPYYDRRTWQHHSDQHANYLENIREKPINIAAINATRSRSAETIQEIMIDEYGKEHVVTRIQPKTTRYLQPLQKRGDAQNNKKQSPSSNGSKQVTKEGRSIDGQYVIVTVDEMTQPTHTLIFRTYDLDTTIQSNIMISFDKISALIHDKSLLEDINRREELANVLLPRLKFKDGILTLEEGEIQGQSQPQQQYQQYHTSQAGYATAPVTQRTTNKTTLDQDEQKPADDMGYEYTDDTTQYDIQDTQGQIQVQEQNIRFLTTYKGSLSSSSFPLIVLYRYTPDGYSEMVSRTENHVNEQGEKEVNIVMTQDERNNANTSLTFKVFDVSDGSDTFHDQSLIGSVTISLHQYMETVSATGNVPLEYTLIDKDGQALDAALAIRLNVDGETPTNTNNTQVQDDTPQQQPQQDIQTQYPDNDILTERDSSAAPISELNALSLDPADSTSTSSSTLPSEPAAATTASDSADADESAGYGDDFEQ